MKRAWPIVRRVLAFTFLALAAAFLFLAIALRQTTPAPAPFLTGSDVQEVYSRNVPYPDEKDAIVVAYTLPGEIADITEQAQNQLKNWVVGRTGPVSATMWRGKGGDFEVVRIVSGQLIGTEDGSVPQNLNGFGFVTVFYARSPSGRQSFLGRLFGARFEAGEESGTVYTLVLPRPGEQPAPTFRPDPERDFWWLGEVRDDPARKRTLARVKF